jgi:hypothetical protein
LREKVVKWIGKWWLSFLLACALAFVPSTWMHDHFLKALAIAAAVGVLVGMVGRLAKKLGTTTT